MPGALIGMWSPASGCCARCGMRCWHRNGGLSSDRFCWHRWAVRAVRRFARHRLGHLSRAGQYCRERAGDDRERGRACRRGAHHDGVRTGRRHSSGACVHVLGRLVRQISEEPTGFAHDLHAYTSGVAPRRVKSAPVQDSVVLRRALQALQTHQDPLRPRTRTSTSWHSADWTRNRTAPLWPRINMTPLIDVMLVLLVIFIITAPVVHACYPARFAEGRVASGARDAGDDHAFHRRYGQDLLERQTNYARTDANPVRG